MNTVIEFYTRLCNFLEDDLERDKGARSKLIILATKCKLSWEPTRTLLGKLLLSASNLSSREADLGEVDKLVLCAFKDLSVIKNPQALKVFRRLQLFLDTHELVFFPKKIIQRESGQGERAAIITLHVSNMVNFMALLQSASNTVVGDPLTGALFYPKEHLPIE